jgi:hypothetical protein
VLSTYSYTSPLLTDRTGLAAGLVPLVLVGFGVGALGGFLVGGRLGDVRPHATTIVAPAVTTVLLLAVCPFSGSVAPTAALVVLLGFFGLGANPVLISLAVRFAGQAPTLGRPSPSRRSTSAPLRLLDRRPRPGLQPRRHRSRRGGYRHRRTDADPHDCPRRDLPPPLGGGLTRTTDRRTCHARNQHVRRR